MLEPPRRCSPCRVPGRLHAQPAGHGQAGGVQARSHLRERVERDDCTDGEAEGVPRAAIYCMGLPKRAPVRRPGPAPAHGAVCHRPPTGTPLTAAVVEDRVAPPPNADPAPHHGLSRTRPLRLGSAQASTARRALQARSIRAQASGARCGGLGRAALGSTEVLLAGTLPRGAGWRAPAPGDPPQPPPLPLPPPSAARPLAKLQRAG